ncbi:F-box only protein 44-like isoform X2 [Phymastichus coffea]|uniref:F-box only protein 44-like isoform X2 n=1 Tax=Phymastichus coffea TaxID=108790 RepID=UPI00273AC541|nr:F-box only protein 44-like isoform X2 [Phymastichus coffea]
MEAICKKKKKKEKTLNKSVLRQGRKIKLDIFKNELTNKHYKTTDKQSTNFFKQNEKSKFLLTNEHKNINGLIFNDKYIPEELLIEILCYVNSKSLLDCQLVCQYWKTIIQTRVWHKKAEQTIQQTLSFDKRTPWMTYYCMSHKMPFDKNLIKNHSGQNGTDSHWELPPISSIQWSTENPMVPLLPDDLSLKDEKVCFVTSSCMTWKYQVIDLIKEGFTSYLLDYLQPTIQVSEWFCCLNTPAKYICDIELLKDNGEKKLIYCSLENYDDSSWDMYNHFTFSRIIKTSEQNQCMNKNLKIMAED